MLGSDTVQVERSDLNAKEKRTRPVGDSTTESSWKGVEGDRNQAHDSNTITQNQVGAGGFLEAALRSLQKGNVRIGVLQEKKLMGDIHMHYNAGYKVWAMEAEIRHKDGITIVRQEETGWHIAGATIFLPNVVSFTIMARRKHWYFFWVIHVPQQSTSGALGGSGPSMSPGGGGDAAGW